MAKSRCLERVENLRDKMITECDTGISLEMQ